MTSKSCLKNQRTVWQEKEAVAGLLSKVQKS